MVLLHHWYCRAKRPKFYANNSIHESRLGSPCPELFESLKVHLSPQVRTGTIQVNACGLVVMRAVRAEMQIATIAERWGHSYVWRR